MRPQAHKAAGKASPGYELSDLPPRPVAMVALAVVGSLLLFGLILSKWLSRTSAGTTPVRGVPFAAVDPLHPLGESGDSPVLSRDELADQGKQRREQEAELHSYGRASDGSIHIPIESAVSLIIARGLPSPAGQQSSPTHEALK